MPKAQENWPARVWREFHADNLTRAFRDVLLTLPSVPMTMRHWPYASLDLGAGEQHRGYVQHSCPSEHRG